MGGVLVQPMVEKISPQALAARLRKALELSGKSQKDLADLFVISEAAVSKWLRTGKIGRDRLPVLAHYLSVSLSWLLSGEGPIKEPITVHVTEDEQKLLSNYRLMDEEGKQAAQALLERTGKGTARLPQDPRMTIIQPVFTEDRYIA